MGRELGPEAAQHHWAEAGLDGLKLRAQRSGAVARDEDCPGRDERETDLLVAL